eukprot:TRINITY_DN3276_c0_g1_i1.p1 TRINITY_DN3276_c0_g1~~TRINITY_DN3276_c0_g1_i1.p1  ORF type:complete len:227 (-),score=45.60 TRINITY_DN3276_c0_g1_i1:136-816(-)
MPSTFGIDPDLYLTDADRKAIAHYLEVVDSTGWNLVHDHSGHQIFLKHDASNPITMCKGVIRIDAPPETIAEFIGDDDRLEQAMKTMDVMCRNAKVVSRSDPKHSVKHCTMGLPPPLWPRDFLWEEIQTCLPDGRYVEVARSTTHPDCPPAHGHFINAVRGEILGTGYLVAPAPDDPNASVVTYQVQCDPKGSIPTMVINLVAKDQGHNVKRLKQYIERKPSKTKT